MQVEEVVIGLLNGARDRIRESMAEKGINATGRTSLSVRVMQEGTTTYKLVAGGNDSAVGGRTAPFETVEIGRAPGGDWRKLRAPIYFWTIAKGIAANDDSHRWAIATNISQRIVEEGTERHKMNVDTYSTIVKETAEQIKKTLYADVNAVMLGAISGNNVTIKTNL